MIIDCHGHYTTAPGELNIFRDAQLAALNSPAAGALKVPRISDDQIRDSLEKAQLKLQRERGSDLTIFSPRASAMGHHLGNEASSRQWARVCNGLIYRVCQLYPDNFAGVCQLPQCSRCRASATLRSAKAWRRRSSSCSASAAAS